MIANNKKSGAAQSRIRNFGRQKLQRQAPLLIIALGTIGGFGFLLQSSDKLWRSLSTPKENENIALASHQSNSTLFATITSRQHDSASQNPRPWYANGVARSTIEDALKKTKDVSHAMLNPGAFWTYGHWIYGINDDDFIEQIAKCAANYEESAKSGCAWTHRVALEFNGRSSSSTEGTSQAKLLYADTQTKASDHQATCNAWGACLQKAWSGRTGPEIRMKATPPQSHIALQFDFQSMYNEQSSAVGQSMEDYYRTMLGSTAQVEKQSHIALAESLDHLKEMGLNPNEFDVADYFKKTGVTIHKTEQDGAGENYKVKIAEYKEGMNLDPLKDLMSMINNKQNHAQSHRARRLVTKILEIRAAP